MFELLPELERKGEKFDLVILDPPAFTKSRASVKKAVTGYREINLRGIKLVKNGGYLATCSCSHFMTPELFTKTIGEAARDARRRLRQVEYRTQSPDHPVLWGARPVPLPEVLYLPGGGRRIKRTGPPHPRRPCCLREEAPCASPIPYPTPSWTAPACGSPSSPRAVPTAALDATTRAPTTRPGGGRSRWPELAAELSGNPLTDGLTLSGGEPFCQAAECAALARIARERGLNVWAYTGYTYERLLAGEVPDALALLEQVDVLVDGPFVEAEKSYAALFRGSANQRLIDVPKSLAAGAVVLWERPDPLAHFTRPES